MSFRDVAGQAHAVDFFRRAIETQRLAHAYILVGPEGVGKRRLARALAQYLFCEARSDDACDECRSCRLIADDRFPDLHWYAREGGKQQLSVDVIRAFQREIGLKPLETDRKVFVLEDADKLNASSANRLLKILEEPPPNSLLVLLALDVRDFLPTILSRCHVIRLRPLRVEELSRRLESTESCSAADAAYLSHFTMGSLGLAKGLVAEGFLARRDGLIDLMVSLGDEEHFDAAEAIYKQADADSDSTQERRERLLRMLDVIALFYRDVLAVTLGGAGAAIINAARADDVGALAKRLRTDRARRVLGSVERARQALMLNANQKLLLENLTFDVAQLQSL